MYFKTEGGSPGTTTTEGGQTTGGTSSPDGTTTTEEPSATTGGTTASPGDCGRPVIPPTKPGDRILNGEEATPHSFPWQVQRLTS